MTFDAARLMDMLPAVYRSRDAASGELRTLLAVIAREFAVVEEDLAQLYDDQFIETCADWVIPYIADLLGTSTLYSSGSSVDEQLAGLFPDLTGPRFVPRAALRSRPDAAKTIYYRKRTATLAMLEELSADVTGWGAHVVEMFEHLVWNQWVRNHLRTHSHGCVDIRYEEVNERLHGPFDSASYTVDVRPIGQLNGWHEVRNVGVFLWRLRSYPLERIDPRPVSNPADHRYFINRLGADVPLFTQARRTEGRAATETEIAGPIRHALFHEDLTRKRLDPGPPAATEFYGSPDGSPDLERSLAIYVGNMLILPEDICAADLSTWPQPIGKRVFVDVRKGRISLGPLLTAKPVSVSYHYGFAGDVGGGGYARSAWMIKPDPADTIYTVVHDPLPNANPIAAAIATWQGAGRPNAIIRITDDHTYTETGPLVLDPPKDGRIAIEAADSTNPHLLASLPIVVKGGEGSMVTLSGLLVEGRVDVASRAGTLRLLHTTLVPSTSLLVPSTTPSVSVSAPAADLDTFSFEAAFSITGQLQLAPASRSATIVDSIIDGDGAAAIAGPALTIERSTVFGTTDVSELTMASESIFTGKVNVERRQQGCARFSFIPYGSLTPRRYRCQPDLEVRERTGNLPEADRPAAAAAVRVWLVPSFTSRHYPDPGYAQLALRVPRQIFTGAEDFAEMGVFCHLKQPQREANLRTRLTEHMPFGFVPGIIYVT
jgi:hypothetical protein